jgi:hypothetical protein
MKMKGDNKQKLIHCRTEKSKQNANKGLKRGLFLFGFHVRTKTRSKQAENHQVCEPAAHTCHGSARVQWREGGGRAAGAKPCVCMCKCSPCFPSPSRDCGLHSLGFENTGLYKKTHVSCKKPRRASR